MTLKQLFQGALLLLSANAAAGDLLITAPYARETPPGTNNSAAFMLLDNRGEQTRSLIAASTTIARKVELHNHVMENGMLQMRPVEAIEISPHQQVELRPGGLHMMLLGLTRPLKEGENIMLTLAFANGERYQLNVPVKSVMSGMQPRQHAAH